jgi:hypothetical protein
VTFYVDGVKVANTTDVRPGAFPDLGWRTGIMMSRDDAATTALFSRFEIRRFEE